jgi:2-amino-4-hydroxy-6-hydroxymethyldihydropteridine diphosphokinase
MANAYLGLGSNVGDKRGNIVGALGLISTWSRVLQVSSLYKTEPVGFKDQDWFLNCAARIATDLAPRLLLERLKSIEKELGRIERIRDGPRTIDLDILFYDGLVLKEEGLTLPHPRLEGRMFVLAPLCEIAASLVHPLRLKTVAELRDLAPRSAGVDRLAPPPGSEEIAAASPRAADQSG